MRLIESKLEKAVGMKEEDMQAFVDEYLQEFAEAAKDLPGKISFTISGFKYNNRIELIDCDVGVGAEKLLADGEDIIDKFAAAGHKCRATVEKVGKHSFSPSDLGSVKYKAVTGLSNTLLGITQYGSTLGVALARVVLTKVDKSVKPGDKAE